MIRKIKMFFNLPGNEKKFFIEAYFLLGVMRALILTVSFKRLTKSLTHAPDQLDQKILTDKQIVTAEKIGRIISNAANNTPWESACLAQALTAKIMLQKRKIPGVFFLGVRKSGTSKEEMEAHAWSQCQDMIITGESGHESFAVMSVFGWDGR